ncbi:hypothetical protein DFH27DRAFT_597870 [Peziza echinospora]|nr:hypothetical protein DFH27DRAFT_597870 [Peziza echinospora]
MRRHDAGAGQHCILLLLLGVCRLKDGADGCDDDGERGRGRQRARAGTLSGGGAAGGRVQRRRRRGSRREEESRGGKMGLGWGWMRARDLEIPASRRDWSSTGGGGGCIQSGPVDDAAGNCWEVWMWRCWRADALGIGYRDHGGAALCIARLQIIAPPLCRHEVPCIAMQYQYHAFICPGALVSGHSSNSSRPTLDWHHTPAPPLKKGLCTTRYRDTTPEASTTRPWARLLHRMPGFRLPDFMYR